MSSLVNVSNRNCGGSFVLSRLGSTPQTWQDPSIDEDAIFLFVRLNVTNVVNHLWLGCRILMERESVDGYDVKNGKSHFLPLKSSPQFMTFNHRSVDNFYLIIQPLLGCSTGSASSSCNTKLAIGVPWATIPRMGSRCLAITDDVDRYWSTLRCNYHGMREPNWWRCDSIFQRQHSRFPLSSSSAWTHVDRFA